MQGSVVKSEANGIKIEYNVDTDTLDCEDGAMSSLFNESKRHVLAAVPAAPDAANLLGVKGRSSIEGFVKAEHGLQPETAAIESNVDVAVAPAEANAHAED